MLVFLLFFLVQTCFSFNCYVSQSSSQHFQPLTPVILVESRRGCEWHCDQTFDCTGFYYNATSASRRSCVLLGSIIQSETCRASQTIYTKQGTGCLQCPSSLSIDLDDDPCIDSAASITTGAQQICPKFIGALPSYYVIRGITENGTRVTLDNDQLSAIACVDSIWNYHTNYTGVDFRQKLVAASCALAGPSKCACPPLETVASGEAPAVVEIVNACKVNQKLKFYNTKMSRVDALTVADTAKTKISCRAGVWVCFHTEIGNSWRIDSASCISGDPLFALSFRAKRRPASELAERSEATAPGRGPRRASCCKQLVPVYIVVVAVLYFERNSHAINSVFFSIYFIGGLVDITTMLNNYLGSIFPAKGWLLWYYLSTPTTGKIYLMIAWGTRMSQGCTILLLAFNRTTAVLRPTSYGKMWTNRVARAATAFQIIPGILYGGALLFTDLHWGQKGNGYYVQFTDPVFRLRYFAASFIGQAILLFFIASNYVIVLLFFRMKYRMVALPTDARRQRLFKEKQKQEQRLVYISMIVCTLEIVTFLFSVYFFVINTNVSTRIFYLVYNALNDLYAATPAYLLIMFSTPFKRNLIKFLGLESSDRIGTGTIPIIRIQKSVVDPPSRNKRDFTVTIEH